MVNFHQFHEPFLKYHEKHWTDVTRRERQSWMLHRKAKGRRLFNGGGAVIQGFTYGNNH